MKKLTLIFIVLAAIALLFTASCKTEEVFNIAGTWNLSMTWIGYGTYPGSMTFTGSETSGTCYVNVPTINTANCTYTVNNLAINIIGTWVGGTTLTMNGTAAADFNSISGAFTQDNGNNGTWTATR